ASLRLQAEPHRRRERRVGLGTCQHALVPAAEGACCGVPRRPRGAGGPGRREGRRTLDADPRRRRNLRRTALRPRLIRGLRRQRLLQRQRLRIRATAAADDRAPDGRSRLTASDLPRTATTASTRVTVRDLYAGRKARL